MQKPKKYIIPTELHKGIWGVKERFAIQKDSFDGGMILPQIVELKDIDKAFIDYTNEAIKLVDDDGKEFPTFTLFSNERFSEYSQTWSHTDNDGNLLMNFKTVTRENNPTIGQAQGGNYNIPGNRKYTICVRDILDDNGTECTEVHSMELPVPVDLKYKINVVSSKYQTLNDFCTKIHYIYQSLQHYLKPNGWYMSTKLSTINDHSEYSIDNRKFFVQSAEIEMKAYFITSDMLHVERFPKRLYINGGDEHNKNKPFVDYQEYDDKTFDITCYFPGYATVCEFNLDYPLKVTNVKSDNIRKYKITHRGDSISILKEGFILPSNGMLNIKIIPFEHSNRCNLILSGTKL